MPARLTVAIAIALCAATVAAPQAPAAPGAAHPAPLSRFQERKAELLLRDALPCLGCHALNGEGGRVGPDLATVRQRRSAEYIASIVRDPRRVVPASAMPHTPMPDETRELIVRYLASRPAGSGGSTAGSVAAPVASSTPRTGAELYSHFCSSCHGVAGRSDGPNASTLPVSPAPHASRERMSQRSDDALFDAISGGGAVMGKSPRMPAFGSTLSREEITSLVRRIRELCRCTGPAWSVDGGNVTLPEKRR